MAVQRGALNENSNQYVCTGSERNYTRCCDFIDEFATALASMLGKLEGGGFSETGKKSAAAAERASDAEAVHNVLEVTNFWFGLGAQAQAHHQASGLDPIAIEGALQDGKIVHWGEWTIRPTPPRYVLAGDGEEYWISTVWVSSPLGFSTFVWNNLGCIEGVCRYIRKKEVVAAEMAMIDDDYEF